MTTDENRGIIANESIVPLLPCVDADTTLAFWESLGFAVTYRQRKPYLYLAFRWSGIDLHYGTAAAGVRPAEENSGGCLVMVDDVAAYHAAFAAAMRAAHGRLLAKGLPRMTRFRPGASRFTIMDPNGNSIIVIGRDEPLELEYGGAKDLTGLARAIDNARILREFKNDDLAAARALQSGLKRHSQGASVGEIAVALAGLIEVCTALGKTDAVAEHGTRLRGLELSEAEREGARAAVADPALLAEWLSGPMDVREP
ncbi:VOC family protein [Kineosporia babensis]|uniref:Glyoxalase n=1 Tax=Kineosporia babensis TaxID=499548 RepID=A0A9X1SYT4_9ACTN|nr:glyoxalase [Kineosporia babensis]MCD5311308.1 glyoxalase [Kineosporia babensis]